MTFGKETKRHRHLHRRTESKTHFGLERVNRPRWEVRHHSLVGIGKAGTGERAGSGKHAADGGDGAPRSKDEGRPRGRDAYDEESSDETRRGECGEADCR